jgi:hypothetical protein
MRPVALGRKNWLHVGQRKGWPQGCGDPLDRGVLPQDWHSGKRVSAGGATRHEPQETFRTRSTHPGSLDGIARGKPLKGKMVKDVPA